MVAGRVSTHASSAKATTAPHHQFLGGKLTNSSQPAATVTVKRGNRGTSQARMAAQPRCNSPGQRFAGDRWGLRRRFLLWFRWLL